MGFIVSTPTYVYQSPSGYIFRIRVPNDMGGQAADSADIALLGLFGEPEQFHVFDEFVFDWISQDLPPSLSE